jgi:predicted outer membrane repeat protein
LTERGDVSVEDCTFEDIINTGILNHGAAISLSNVILQYVGVNISRSYFRRIEVRELLLACRTDLIGDFQAGTYSDGGALWSRQGAVNIVGSTFEDNTAKRGAAIAAFGGTTTSITDCNFNNNTAIGDAGAVLFSSIEQAASTSIVGVTLSGNTFIGNRAGGNGGAVLGVDFQASLTGNTFKCNFGHNGGAIAFDRQATILNGQTGLTFQNNVLISNEASSSGGGLYLDTSVGYTIQLGSNTFYRNWAAHSGGAITCNIGKVTWSGDQANIVENTVENGKGAAWYESQCTCLSGQNIYMSGNAASGPNNHTLWWGPFGEPDLKCGSFYAGTVPIDYSRKPSLTCVGDTTIPTLSFPPPFQGFDSVQMQPGGETGTSGYLCKQNTGLHNRN